LANRKVLRAIDSTLDDTVPAARPITLRDLLTFRVGIGAVMVFPDRYPIQKAMAELGLAPGPRPLRFAPDEFMDGVGRLPLIHQPGERWMYHTGSDILGVLIARASGMSLGSFLKERIFEPLGMEDTGFSVPEAKLGPLAACYQGEPASGRLAAVDEARGGGVARAPVCEGGGGGLVSRADDDLAFARMMLRHGRHGGERILSRPAVEVMTADQLTAEQKAASPFVPGFWDTRGWGFGWSVITRRD